VPSRRGVPHGEYRGKRSVRRTFGYRGPSKRDEIAENRLGVGARCEHEAIERRGVVVEVAGYLDPVSVPCKRFDDLVVEQLRVRGYEQIIDFLVRQGGAGGVQHLNFESLNVRVQDIEVRKIPCCKKAVDLELPLRDHRADEFAREAVALKIVLAGFGSTRICVARGRDFFSHIE